MNPRSLLESKGILEQWYEFESEAQETALREWCEFNSIEVRVDKHVSSGRRKIA